MSCSITFLLSPSRSEVQLVLDEVVGSPASVFRMLVLKQPLRTKHQAGLSLLRANLFVVDTFTFSHLETQVKLLLDNLQASEVSCLSNLLPDA